MQTSVTTATTLSFRDFKTYLVAVAFIAGNIVLPQLFHLVPQGGVTWLPIYFFTLIGAWRYGWKVGVLTALASPVVNSLLFGMPAINVLPAIMLKSTLLALFAGIASHRFGKASLHVLALVVLASQVVGTLGEWMLCGDFSLACQDFRIGIPGMLLQILGGCAILNLWRHNR